MTKRTINHLSVDPNTDQKRKKMCKTQYEVPLQKYIVETLGCDYKGLTGFIHFSNSEYRRFKIYFEQMLRFEIEYEAEEDIEFREFHSFKDAVDFFLVGKEVKDGYQKIYEQAKKNISAGLDKLHTAFLNGDETYVLVKMQTKYNNKNKSIMAENHLKTLFKAIDIALKSAPPPPVYIPDNVCCTVCHVCYREWFENTITTFLCQCKELRLCPKCANEMKEPEVMEHNLVDCNYVGSESSDSEI